MKMMRLIFLSITVGLLSLQIFCDAAVADPSADIAARTAAMRAATAADATRLAAVKSLQHYAGSIKPLVQSLVSALGDKSADVRSCAARSLAEIGPSARDASAAIIALMNDKDESVRTNAALAIGEIGCRSEEAMCGLAFLLQDSSPSVRGQAAMTFGKFGPAAEAHRPALIDMLNDSSVETATSAAIALAATGEPVPEGALFYVLALNRDAASHKLAESSLPKIGTAGVDALVASLNKSKEITVRREAATMLGKMGEDAKRAVPALKEALADKDAELQNRAAMTLVDLDDVPIEASLPMIRVMRDYDAIRAKCLAAFAKMNEHATDVPLELMKATGDVHVRRQSARVLGHLAPRFRQNPEPLAFGLNDVDETVRSLSIEALANCGAEPKKLVPLLVPALIDKSYDIGVQAAKVLATFRDEPLAMVALADARLKIVNPSVKAAAGKGIWAAGASARPALPALIEALKTEDLALRTWALKSIANIGPDAADAVPQLVECISRCKTNRDDIADALGKIGEKAVDPLIPLLANPDLGIRGTASIALGRIGALAFNKVRPLIADANPDTAEAALLALEGMAPASQPAISDLIKAANSKVTKIQYAASGALVKLGSLAVPALIEELKSPDEPARRAAAYSLGLIGRGAVRPLVDALRTEQDTTTIIALVNTLGRVGSAAADSVPTILEIAGRAYTPKERSAVWTQCASALGSIGAARETAVPVLFGMLAVEDRLPHATVAASIHALGSEDHRVPPLEDVLKCALPAQIANALKPFGRAGMMQLIAAMENNPPEIRDAAAKSIACLVPECVPFLKTALDENPAASVGIILAIGEVRTIEIERRTAKPVASTPAFAAAAMKALEELQKALDACTPALRKKIESGTPDEALAALWALGKPCGNGLEPVVKNYAACSPDMRSRGFATLAYYDLKGQSRTLVRVLPFMLKECGLGASIARKKNAALVQSAGYCAEGSLDLADALEDPSIHVRAAALDGFKSLGAEARSAGPKLILLVEESNATTALAASTALTAMGPDSVPQLLKAMSTGSAKLRTAAYTILLTLKLTPHLGLIADLAADEREEISSRALYLIASLKEEGRPAEAKVREQLIRDNDVIFSAAARALSKMGVNVFSALAKHADNTNATIALRSIAAMSNALPKDPGTIADFVSRQLKNENPEIRAAVIALLPGKEAGVGVSMPVIAAAMKDAYYGTRTAAMVWLFDNAPLAPDTALPIVMAGLKDPYSVVINVAGNSLINLGEKTKPYIPEIIMLLNSPAVLTRTNAANVLVKLGVDDPLAKRISNEANAAAQVEAYYAKQELYFEEHFTQENVHHFAATFLDLLGKAGKDLATKNEPDGAFHLDGFKVRILTHQSARAEGGAKSWLSKGVLANGHALIAWPDQPAVSGRFAYLCGPDGALYERPVTEKDAPFGPGDTAGFDPGPEWKKTFTPVKIAPRVVPHYFKPKSSNTEEMEF